MASTPKETTTKTEPWDGAKPYLLEQYKKMDELTKAGNPNYYPDSTVIEQSQATKDAQARTEAIARAGSPLIGNAQNAVNGVTTGSAFDQSGNNTLKQGMGYTNPGTAATQQAMGGINQNYTNPATAQAAALTNFTNGAIGLQQNQANALANGNNPAKSMLEQTANGSMLNSNPYLQTAIKNANQGMLDQFSKTVSPQIDSQASLAGRTGSGAAASIRNDAETTLANAMSKNTNDMMLSNYTQERNNQLNAQNQIGNFYNTDQQNQMAANSNLAQTSNSNQSQNLAGTQLYGDLNNAQQQRRNDATGLALQGAGQLGSQSAQQQQIRNDSANAFNNNQNNQNALALQGAGMAGGMRELDYLDASKLGAVGAQKDAYADLLKQDDINRWDWNQNKDINNVGNFTNVLTGGGFNNQTTKKPGGSGAAGILGGLVSILGLL